MAMPASGSIAIINDSLQTCSSISCAVDGNNTPPKSLSTLSVSAGFTAPHCMREFYSYAPSTPTPINFGYLYYNSGDNSTYSYSYYCADRPDAGDCYCLCTYYNLCVDFFAGQFSYARFCARCNGIVIYDCCITCNDYCVNAPWSVTVRPTDCVWVYNYASESPASLGPGVRSQICISTIQNIVGSYCRGTTCCNICRYTSN